MNTNYDEKKRTHMYISVNAIKKFKIMCIEQDRNVSEVVNEFIIKSVEEYEKSKKNV